MSDFAPAEALILTGEGVWSNTPGDAGKETCFGIDMVSNPTWPGWSRCHALLFLGIPKHLWHADSELMSYVNEFYRNLWDTLHGDQEKSQSLANSIFGGVVNQGPQRVIRMVQICARALGQDILVDGSLGTKTVDACNACPPERLLSMLKTMRHAAYITTAAMYPNDRQFLRGWENRLELGA